MQISFKNYGCHKNLNIKFKEGLNLLKGPSGAGKSTILKSIPWAFYGGLNSYGTASTRSLTLKYNDLEITRASDKKVTLVKDEQKYIGEEANTLIKTALGLPSNESIWKVTSYIEQNMHSLFLKGLKHDEKVDILNNILFTDNPDEYLQKLDVEKKKQLAVVDKVKNEYELKKAEIEKDFSDVSEQDIMTKEEFENFKQELKELQKTIENDKKNRERCKFLTEQKTEHEKYIYDVASLDKSIEKLKTRLEKAIYYEDHLDRYNLIQNALKKLNINNIKYTIEELKEFKRAEELREIYSKSCDEYTEQWITKTKNELNEVIEFFNKYEYEIKQASEIRKELKNLDEERTSKINKLENLGLEELIEKYTDISEEDVDELELLDEITALKNKTIEYKNYEKISSEINEINNQIKSYNVGEIKYTSEQLKKFIQDHNDISKYKEKCDEYTQEWLDSRKAKLMSVFGQFISIENDLPKYNEFKNNLKKALNNKKVNEGRLKNLEDEIKVLKIDDIDVKSIAELEAEVEKLSLLINILKCPHCNKSVIYDGVKLNKAHGDVISREIYEEKVNELKELNKRFKENESNIELKKSKLNEKAKLEDRIKQLTDEVNTYTEKIEKLERFKNVDRKQLTARMEELNSIKIIEEPPVDLDTCTKMLKCIALQKKLNDIKLPEYPGDLDIIETELKEKTKTYKKIKSSKKLKADIDKLTLEKQHIENSINEIERSMDKLKSKLSSCKEYNGKITKEEALKRLKELEQVEYIEKSPLSLDECNRMIEYINLTEELEKIGKLEYVGKRSEIMDKLEECKNKKNISLFKAKEIKKITDEINSIKLVDNLDDLISQYEKMKKRKPKIHEAIKYQEKKLLLDGIYDKYLKEQKHYNNIIKLQEKMNDILYRYLEDTVETLNESINDILDSIFDDSMLFKIKMFKEDKNNTRRLNLSIEYKGCKYHDIKCLSGGEQSRLSFAITVALNRLTNSNILILDECFASLDFENRRKCIEVLKEKDIRIVICVNHEDIEGLYENIITLQ